MTKKDETQSDPERSGQRVLVCPFCGCKGSPCRETPSAYWLVVCTYWKCGAQGPDRKELNEAIAAWNTRIKTPLAVRTSGVT